jgi:glycerophosphoryl diester phosphodiesterase
MKINKKKQILILIGLILFFSVYYLFFFEPKYDGTEKILKNSLLIAHRGFGDYAPDNGLSAVEKAIDLNLDGVDLDAQLTLDREWVIFHDPTLERVTDGEGSIGDKTLKELKQLDIGYGFYGNYTNEKILTLGEMIKKVDKRTLMIVEIKSAEIKNTGIEEKAVLEIQQNNAYENVYLSSFNPLVVYRIEKIDPKVKTVFIFRDIEPYDPTQYKKIPFFLKKEPFRKLIRKIIKPDFLSVETTVSEDTIETLIEKGYQIFLWTPNTKSEIMKNLDKNPFGIISDEPFLLSNSTNQEK